MSIALTVTLRPSVKLHIVAILFSLVILFVGIYLCATGDASHYWHYLSGTFSVIVAISCYLKIRSLNRKTWRIAVNDHGEFQCTCLNYRSTQRKSAISSPYVLASGTTLWSNLLFLRLKGRDSNTLINLMIFSDALNKDEFRQISIACRWVVRQPR